ncbi:hypothetical protein [Sphingosinicella sp. BN140058]|uniref:hypothetical protein n=1 Tax=Sphingosinicella sp. BN140058 TaxID=1892855 RepID=UPI00101363B3|nr:hypothetical protein [Sphingosinicella sp. BN140058]QAY80123.1 hypothetical protein ETR14_26130 [Sphingosinicella sp. BN140058]
MARKLVRDRLATRIPMDQLRFVKNTDEHLALLREKLCEEGDEIAASSYADPVEYADALQTLMDMAETAGIPWETIEQARLGKLADRGGFLGGLVYQVD